MNKSFGCKPFNSQWVSSEHLVTLRAVEWFLSELLFTLRATEFAKKLSEHIWLVAAQTPTSKRVRLGMAGPVVRTPAKRPRLTGKSPDQPQQDLSPQSTPPRSRSPRYLRRSPPSSPPFNGFEPAQMKPVFNLSQLDEESEDINELDKGYELCTS